MSLPDNTISSAPVQAAQLAPDNADRSNLRVDYELGGIALSDPSQGLQLQTWEAWSDGASVWVAPSPSRTPTTLLMTSGGGITEVALSFDQNMRPTIAFVDAGVTKLFWFDASVAGMVTTTYEGATSPMLTLDDKRAFSILGGISDVLFFYLRAGLVCYRQQRDRFTIERTVGSVGPGARIVKLGMGANNRIQAWINDYYGVAYTDLLTDTLYTLDAGQVVPMFQGAAATGIWRSAVFRANAKPSMAWAKVEADYPVTIRVYADGTLVMAPPPFTSDDPIRLPSVRGADWYIEVESTGNRVVQVVLASSLAELIGG